MKEGDFGGRVFYWGAEEEVLGGELEEGADWCADDVVLLTDDSDGLQLDYLMEGWEGTICVEGEVMVADFVNQKLFRIIHCK